MRIKNRSIPFVLFGDSMVKNIDRRICESSKCISRNGEKLDVIIKEAKESTIEMNDGMIVIQ